MKLYLKRDTSSDSARFEVLDERGDRYLTATGRRNPAGETVRLCRDGRAIARIRDLNLSVLNAYGITTPSESARLILAIGGGTLSARFRGISFYIRGDVLSGAFDILDADNTVVCAVSKKLSKGYTELTVYNSQRELFCIASVICIESVASAATPMLQTV